MSRPWMPLYVGDYLADTGHLRAAEHGAYLMLIMHYWQKGGLPDDDRQLAAIARMTAPEWKRARPLIEPFFKSGWKHERIERELAAAKASYERRANAGRKGGIATHSKEQPASNAPSNARPLPEQSHSQPHISSSLRSEDSAPPAPREQSASQILKSCLSEETARDLIAHRKANRSPLTPRAAKLLVESFRSYGDPEGAAREMIARGWKGFKPEWMRDNARAGPYGRPERRNPALEAYEIIMAERNAEIAAEVERELADDYEGGPTLDLYPN